jgi:hypothetical protein
VKIEEEKYEWNEFYRMIADANLEGIRGSVIKELPQMDEYTKIFELTGFKPQFKDAYEDAFLQFGHHAKGVLPTEVLKEFLIERYREEFRLPESYSVIIDITGSNRGNYLADMMVKDDNRITFFGEAESRWSDEKMDLGIFNRIKKDLEEHSNEAKTEGLVLPNQGYGFIVIYRQDKIVIYVRKYSFDNMDWVRW